MRFSFGIVALFEITALFGALNLYFAISTGSPFSWAATYFITLCCALELISYGKVR